jgi:hypothetical protein
MDQPTPSDTPKAERKPIAWAAMKPHYEAGIISVSALSRRFNVTRRGIEVHAQKHGWMRAKLKDQIQVKAQELVAGNVVRAPVTPESGIQLRTSIEIDEGVIQVNAEALAVILLGQRQVIERSRRLADMLLAELEQAMAQPDLAGRIYMALNGDNPDADVRRELLDMATFIASLPERAKVFKTITEGLARVVALERESYGLHTNGRQGDEDDEPTLIVKDYTGKGSSEAPLRITHDDDIEG